MIKKIRDNILSCHTDHESILVPATRNYWLIAVVVSISVGLLAATSGIEPTTDFLRHIREYDYRSFGGYGYMFPESMFNHIGRYNPYYLFDSVVGWVSSFLGREQTTSLFEGLCFSLYSFAIYWNIRPFQKRDGRLAVAASIAVGLFVCAMFCRVVQIRPVMFVSVFLCFLMPTRSFLIGLTASLVIAGMHWLYFLYTIPVAIAHYISGSRRTSYGIIAGSVIAFGILLSVSDSQYIVILQNLLKVTKTDPALVCPEFLPPIWLIFQPSALAIIYVFVDTLSKRPIKVDVYLITLICFSPLCIQHRFAHDQAIPLMMMYILHAREDILFRYTYKRIIPILLCLSISTMVFTFCYRAHVQDKELSVHQPAWLRSLDLPAGTRVYSNQSYTVLPLIYGNDAPLQIYPPLEPKLSDDKTTEMLSAKIITSKRLDNNACGFLSRHKIDYVLTEAVVSADCLVADQQDLTELSVVKLYKTKNIK